MKEHRVQVCFFFFAHWGFFHVFESFLIFRIFFQFFVFFFLSCRLTHGINLDYRKTFLGINFLRLIHPEIILKEFILAQQRERGSIPQATGTDDTLFHTRYLEWRNCLSMGYDNGDDVETSKREAFAEPGRWARVEALHAVPRSVLIATLGQQTYGTRRHGRNDFGIG